MTTISAFWHGTQVLTHLKWCLPPQRISLGFIQSSWSWLRKKTQLFNTFFHLMQCSCLMAQQYYSSSLTKLSLMSLLLFPFFNPASFADHTTATSLSLLFFFLPPTPLSSFIFSILFLSHIFKPVSPNACRVPTGSDGAETSKTRSAE